MNIIVSLVLILLLSACSSSAVKIERTSGMQVSVTTNDGERQSLTKSYVHRVQISKEVLGEWISTDGKLRADPIFVKPETNQHSTSVGLIVVEANSMKNVKTFGLEVGDIITAVNRDLAKNQRSIEYLLQELTKTKNASITISRQGLPHKIIYSVR